MRAFCDTPHGLKPRRLLPLLCTREAEKCSVATTHCPRNGGGKARKQCLHSGVLFPGRCHARWCSHAFPKGMNGPQLRFLASWRVPTPELFSSFPWERTRRGGGFSLTILLQTLHFLRPWIGYPYLRSAKIAFAHWLNAVTFLHMALHHATRTLFSFQSTEKSLPH